MHQYTAENNKTAEVATMIHNDCKEIREIRLRQIYSERRQPGLEAHIYVENGAHSSAICSGGVSVGSHEVPFTYDCDAKWGGKGLSKAIKEAENYVIPLLLGMDVTKQNDIDEILIECRKKYQIGGNITASISAATLKAGAEALEIPLYKHIGGEGAVTLPVPGAGLVGGRRRYNTGKLTNKPSYSVLAYDFPSFSEASYALWEINALWSEELMKRYSIKSAKDGYTDFIPGMLSSDKEIWDLATEIIIRLGYENKVGLQVDAASDSYYDTKTGLYTGLFNAVPRTRDEQIDFLVNMVRNYPFVCIEDPLFEDDYEGTAIFTNLVDIQVVGDDLFTTNSERVKYGIEKGACNTVLLKVNQVGTFSEAMDMVDLAKKSGYGIMPCSSRGEGPSICDYCVGINAGSVRESGLGAYGNRFLEIEAELGSKAKFAGKEGLKGKRFHG